MKVLKTKQFVISISLFSLFVFAVLLSDGSNRAFTLGDVTASAASIRPGETLNNLQIAFDGESNAEVRYSAFAEKAEAEGYGKVASLFRAASRAEAIHARNHSEVIRKLGGTPTANVKPPEVKGTAENLDAAIKGESYERDVMYPDFLKQARADGTVEALRTFNLARNAEAEHAKLYKDARNNLETWKGDKQTFYVCPVCGFTTSNLNFERCPTSGTARERFLTIN
jgi:rubrerythrin